jgi:hypothetical protein
MSAAIGSRARLLTRTMTTGISVVSVHDVPHDWPRPDTVLDELCRCIAADFDVEHSASQPQPPARRR